MQVITTTFDSLVIIEGANGFGLFAVVENSIAKSNGVGADGINTITIICSTFTVTITINENSSIKRVSATISCEEGRFSFIVVIVIHTKNFRSDFVIRLIPSESSNRLHSMDGMVYQE